MKYKYIVDFNKISKQEQGYVVGLILGDGYQISTIVTLAPKFF